jgi:Tfp pilus assembly protein PilF
VKEIKPEAHLLGAAAYAGLKRFREGIVEIRAAIAKSPAPQEQWYQLLLAMYVELKDYPEATKTLHTVLGYWPGKADYWKQLASIYTTMDRLDAALGVYEMALAGGFLKNESDILNVAGLYMFIDVPLKAAQLLEKEMAAGLVKPNSKNLETLGTALLRAQEIERAITVYRKATATEDNPKLDLLAAQLLLDAERWDEAIAALKHLTSTASYRTTLDSPGLAHVLLGSAYFEKGLLAEARAAFQDGLQFDAVRANCAQWIESLEATEAARKAQQDSETP